VKDPSLVAVRPIYSLEILRGPGEESVLGFSTELPPLEVKGTPLTHSLEGACHLKLRADDVGQGRVVLRGKSWTASESEPAAWMVTNAPVLLRRPLDQICLTTVRSAVTFQPPRLKFIE
jgi:hypothetical protein